MQYWIHFLPGAGGDGIGNLLNFSTNVRSLQHDIVDMPDKRWNVHREIDRIVKFNGIEPDKYSCFRNNEQFRTADGNFLRPEYINAVDNNDNIIITSHDVFLKNLRESESQEYLTKNRIDILLYSNDLFQMRKNALVKNLQPFQEEELIYDQKYLRSYIDSLMCKNSQQFDYVFDISEWQDWTTVKSHTEMLGLDLPQEVFQDYIRITNGQPLQHTPLQQNYDCYESYVNKEGIYEYRQISCRR